MREIVIALLSFYLGYITYSIIGKWSARRMARASELVFMKLMIENEIISVYRKENMFYIDKEEEKEIPYAKFLG